MCHLLSTSSTVLILATKSSADSLVQMIFGSRKWYKCPERMNEGRTTGERRGGNSGDDMTFIGHECTKAWHSREKQTAGAEMGDCISDTAWRRDRK